MNFFRRWIKHTFHGTTSVRVLRKRTRLHVEALEDRITPTTPSVLSIDYLNPASQYTNAASVAYGLTFNTPVNNVVAADFQVVTTDVLQAATPVVVSGSNASYTVTVDGIHGSGTLQLDLIGNGTITSQDTSTPLGGAGNGSFQGQIYTIDQADPYVVSINRAAPAGALTNASAVAFTVTFSEPVTGVNPTDFALATTGTIGTTLTQVTPVSGSNGAVYTVTVSGITGNGTLGLNLVDNGSIRNPLYPSNAPASLLSEQTLAANARPYKVAAADLNGDGKIDLIYPDGANADVAVLLGNGNGTFQAPVTYATGSVPYSVQIADVNGDGVPDILIANLFSDSVSVLLGNGNGTFQPQQTVGVGSRPRALSVADLNGDGQPDLIVANQYANTVSVLLGNGNGTFQALQTFATGNNANSVTVGDVNGDGIPDIVAANFIDTTVSVLLGNGNGTFQPQQTFAAGNRPYSVKLADLNGDGNPDIVVTDVQDATVSVLLGNGNGTFQARQTFATDNIPFGLAVADMNGDGKLDLVVANAAANTVGILLGNGDGTFQAEQTFSTSPSGLVYSVAVADLNGDGRPDVATADYVSSTASVLLNANNGNFTGQTYTIDHTDPYVQSINLGTPAASLTNASAVSWTVTFSEPVTGVNPTDFSLVTTGTIGTTLTQVMPVSGSNEAIYTFTASGISGNGTVGLNLVDNGTIHDLAGNPLTNPNAPASFQAQQTYATGTGPVSIALADLTGDGKQDLIAVNEVSNTVSVLLGNGNGTFQGQQTFAVGADPYSVTVADLAGDGIADLVVANYQSNTVSVLLGNGNGTFQAQQTVATGIDPRSVAVGDVNGDGIPDLVVANAGSSTVSVLLGNGNGAFQAQQTFFAGSYPLSVALGDLTDDGIPDLIVANRTTNTVSVLLGNGNGTFQAEQTFATGFAPDKMVVGDMNGDGVPDLVVANYGSNSVSVLLGNGNGSFQSQQTFAAGATHPLSLALGDMNGDGIPDLVVSNFNNSLNVLLGNGDGSFQAPQSFATAAGHYPVSLVVGDLNGDGRPDVVVTNDVTRTVSVFLNDSNGNFTGQVYTIDHTDPYVQSINFATPATSPTNASAVSWTVTFSEPVTGVAPTDFALATTGTIGTTLTQVTPVSGSVYTFTASGIAGSGTLGLNLVDNGSIHDLAGNPLTTPNAPASFQNQQTYAVGATPFSVTMGDLTGNGIQDLVVANASGETVSVLLGNGNGTFQAQQTFATGTFPVAVAIGDLSGDGIPDLAVANYQSDSVSVLLGNGNGTFQAQQTFAVGTGPFSIALADLTGNGKEDLVVANDHSDSVSVLLGNGNGTFQAQQTFATGVNPQSAVLGDLNGDGIPDIVVLNAGVNTLSVLLGNGNGTFQAQQTFATGSLPSSLVLEDVNGDGKPDLAVANSTSNTVSVLLGNGDGTFQAQQTFATGSYPRAVALEDVNGDSTQDLVVANEQSNTVGVLLGNGNGTFQAQQTFAAGADPHWVAVGGLTGDGRADLVVANLAGTVGVLLNNSNGNFTGQVYTIDHTDPYVESINFATPATSPTNASTVSWTVTFSEPVTDVAPSGFALALSGVTASTPVGVSGSGSVYTVAVSGITGSGTLGLNLVDDGSIHDLAGNPLTQPNATASFQSQQTYAVGNGPGSVVAADLTGSGITDLIVANAGANSVSVLLGNGNGTFQAQQTYATSTDPSAVTVADLNGDGIPDVIVTDYLNAGVSVLLGNGNGTFQAQQTFATGTHPRSVAVADVNGDGTPDLIVGNAVGSSVSVLLGNGNGTFQAQQTFATGNFPISVAAADLRGDGIPDLVVADYSDSAVSVLMGNGNGTFQSQQTFATATGPRSVAVTDLNGDGKLDLVVAAYSIGSSVGVLLGNGDGTFQAQQTFATGTGPLSVATADVNGDGIPDLILANHGSDSASILLGNSNGTFQSQNTFAVGGSPLSVAAADLTGDGKADLAVANYGGNSVSVLLNSLNGNFTGQVYTIDQAPPTSTVSALPAATTTASFTVSWSGNDNGGGDSIASYSVFVSDNGGAFTPFLANTTLTSATFDGTPGHTYGFYSVATDLVGNVQPTPGSAQATTTVLLPLASPTVISHGSTAPISLSTLDPSPVGAVSYTVTIADPLLTLKTTYGLTLQDGYFDYRHQNEKYVLSNNGSNSANGGWYVLMPTGQLYTYIKDAANDLDATLAQAPLATLAPSVYDNPTLLTGNTGAPIATSGTNPFYDLKIQYGLVTAATSNKFGADEWDLQSSNGSNKAGGGLFVLMPDNRLYASGASLGVNQLVADFNLAPYATDVYANPALLTSAVLPTAVGITAATSSNFGGELTLTPAAGFDRSVSVTVQATDSDNTYTQTFTFTVTDVAPSITPVSPVTVNHNSSVPTVPLTVTDPDPDAALRTFSVVVTTYNPLSTSPTVASNRGPLYDIQTEYGLTIASNPATINKRGADEKYLQSANGSNPAGGGMYVLMPSDKLYAWDGVSIATTIANAPVADFTQPQYAGVGNVWAEPSLLTSAQPAFNHDPVFNVKQTYGLTTANSNDNLRGQQEKYLKSGNGSNAANGGWYVLMPNDELYAYVKDSKNDLTATLANPPVFNFTPYANVYANPFVLYAGTGQVAAVTASISPAGVITLTPNSGFAGTVRITATVSDGAEFGTQSFLFTVNDNAPTLGPIGPVTVPSTAGSATVNFTASTYNGASVEPAASISGFNPLFNVQQLYGLTAAPFKTTSTAKYFKSTNGSNPAFSNEYVLSNNDELYAWAGNIKTTLAGTPVVDFASSTYAPYNGAKVYKTPTLLYKATEPAAPSITTSFPSPGQLMLTWPSGYKGTFLTTLYIGDGALETQQSFLVTVD